MGEADGVGDAEAGGVSGSKRRTLYLDVREGMRVWGCSVNAVEVAEVAVEGRPDTILNAAVEGDSVDTESELVDRLPDYKVDGQPEYSEWRH